MRPGTSHLALVSGAARDIVAACATASEAQDLRTLRLDYHVPPGMAKDWIACDLANPVARKAPDDKVGQQAG